MSLDKLTDQQALIPLMSRLMKEFKALITNEFHSHGVQLSKEQVIVLKKLLEQDGRPQNDLALVTSRDKTSLTRLLTTMERKDLIRRRQCISDKRVNLIFITPKGRAEFEKASPVILKIINQAIHGIDEHRIVATKSMLKDIYTNLNLKHEE